MPHKILYGATMERFGLLGFFWTWVSYLVPFFLNEQFLKELSLILAIIVSILTIFWYLGQMTIQRKKIWQAIKEMFR